MKRKFKLISSIASLTAAVALLAVGVFAVGTRTVNVQGTVNFIATNVSATVKVYEAFGGAEETEISGGGYVFVAATSGKKQDPQEEALKLGNNGAIAMNDDNLVYVYRIEVKSDQLRDLKAVFAETAQGGEGYTVAVSHDSQTITGIGNKVDFTVTVTITDPAKLASDWSLSLAGSLVLSIPQS